MENIATYIAPCSPEQILGDREEVTRSLDAIRLQREEALRRSQEMSLSFDSTQSEVRGSDKIQGGKGGGCGGWHYHTIQHVLCHYHTGTYVAHSHTHTCTHTHTHTQLTLARNEVANLTLRLQKAQEEWEHEKLALQEQL